MFDLGFWELILIAIVALLVVGPERLPGLARSAGLWMGRLRRFIQSVKQDISQELAAEELQRTLKKNASIPELEEIVEETGSVGEELTQTVTPEQQQSAKSMNDTDEPSGYQSNKSHDGTQ